jgi:hypothetical protein
MNSASKAVGLLMLAGLSSLFMAEPADQLKTQLRTVADLQSPTHGHPPAASPDTIQQR